MIDEYTTIMFLQDGINDLEEWSIKNGDKHNENIAKLREVVEDIIKDTKPSLESTIEDDRTVKEVLDDMNKSNKKMFKAIKEELETINLKTTR